jgi:hypothetical protein
MRRDEFGFGKSDRLELWKLTPKGIERIWQCVPYADEPNQNDRDLKWGAFLRPKRFATLSSKGRFALWDLDPVRPTLTVDMTGGGTPALSPDGKLLAFTADKQLGLLDLDAGQIVALGPLPADHLPWPVLLFSPSGKQLACVSQNTLYVWDTATGRLDRTIALETMVSVGQGPAAWTDDDHMLVSGSTLIDIPSQVRLWAYNGFDLVQSAPGGPLWFLTAQGGSSALVPAVLPHPAVAETLQKTITDPDAFILRNGSSVSIDPSGIPDASRRNGCVEALTQRFGTIGVTVQPGAPLVAQLSVTPGEEREIVYQDMRSFQRDKFKIRPQISHLKLVYNNQVVWETSATSVPLFESASLDKDESLTQHVRKFEQPNYDLFGRVDLPRLLAKPSGPKNRGSSVLGQSTITPTGIR